MNAAKENENRVTVDGTTFVAWPDHGSFVEQGKTPYDVGALFIPMAADGSPWTYEGEPDVGEIEVPYDEA